MKASSTPSVVGIARRGLLKLAAAAAGALLFSGAAQAQAPAKTKVAAIYTVPVEQQWVSRIHKALTAALLIYWCYAMELPLAESGGAPAGRA